MEVLGKSLPKFAWDYISCKNLRDYHKSRIGHHEVMEMFYDGPFEYDKREIIRERIPRYKKERRKDITCAIIVPSIIHLGSLASAIYWKEPGFLLGSAAAEVIKITYVNNSSYFSKDISPRDGLGWNIIGMNKKKGKKEDRYNKPYKVTWDECDYLHQDEKDD